MSDAIDLVRSIKKAAMEAVESGKPVNVMFGKVETINPLTINIEQKMILGEKQLILARNVTQFSTNVTVPWESVSVSTTHDIVENKQMTFHWDLKVGEEVILIRQQGGQKFVVIDRVGGDFN